MRRAFATLAFGAGVFFTLTAQGLAWRGTRQSTPPGTQIPGGDQPPDASVVPYPDEEGVSIGDGFDLITGRRRSARCVDSGKPEKIFFGDKNSSFSEVVDKSSLTEKLNTSLSAKASYAGFSGSASFQSSVETTTSTKNITLVAQATLKTYAMILDVPNEGNAQIDLTTAASNLFDKSSPLFREICRDGFVAQITTGAELYGLYTFFNLSYEQKRACQRMQARPDQGMCLELRRAVRLDSQFQEH